MADQPGSSRYYSGTCNGWISLGKVQSASRIETGVVLDTKSQGTGIQGLPLSLGLWAWWDPAMQVAPGTAACKPPHHCFIPGNALSPELRDRAALCLLGPAQRLHGAIHQKDGRPWSWERAWTGETAMLLLSFSYLAPAGVQSSRCTGGEPGEGSVSRQSRGPAPPPPAQPASLFLAFWPNPPGEAPGKDKAIKLMKY